MLSVTFVRPDLTTFCRLDELGLEAVGQHVGPDRAVLECRVVEVNLSCLTCGADGMPRDTTVCQLTHEPFANPHHVAGGGTPLPV